MTAIPILLWCPECGKRHIDEGEFATKEHHTHACQHCGHCWRPAVVPTCGVQFLPGFKSGHTPEHVKPPMPEPVDATRMITLEGGMCACRGMYRNTDKPVRYWELVEGDSWVLVKAFGSNFVAYYWRRPETAETPFMLWHF